MYLDYSKLEFDSEGNPESPALMLKTMSGEALGVIPGISNMKLNVKFVEPSELEFDVAARLEDGMENPLYADITGYRRIETKTYGVYITMNPTAESDGIKESKHVRAYSLEKMLEKRKFFLEATDDRSEGGYAPYRFYDRVNPGADTVIARIREVAPEWNVGEIPESVAQRYRSLEQYDGDLLNFVYSVAPEKYRCIFVFDPYDMKFSVYDVDAEIAAIPIYLDFDNLLKSAEVEEKTDEIVTAIRPYGADELDILEVNPTGTNWVYDLSYFVAHGDIPAALGRKYTAWQQRILNHQPYYRSLCASRRRRN